MGFRFQKRIGILPGVRINLSKSGLSASLGPRGADVNIGRNGITTNAGIPGTGLSYRSKVGSKTGMLGILALVLGLGFAAYKNADKIAHVFAPATPASAPVRASTPAPAAAPVNMAPSGVPGALRYVHRDGSVLREKPKTSAKALKKESKGAQLIILAEGEGWSKVQDGGVTGWMRSSVLGANPPQ